MPLFRRSDGVPVRDLPPLRGILPYVMRGRNESAFYLPLEADVSRTREWLRAFNRASDGPPCTLMHLVLYYVGALLNDCPEFNRFVVGRRLYQRTDTTVSLVVLDTWSPTPGTLAVKFPLNRPGESLPEFVQRAADAIRNAAESNRAPEFEARLLLRFPDPVVRLVVWLRDVLDSWNLLPSKLLRDDPLCTSVFFSNLGSIGVPLGFHHLYECGTCSLFFAMGSVQKRPIVAEDGTVQVRPVLSASLTIDDRVAEGMRLAAAIQFRDNFQDPAASLGSPQDAARGLAVFPRRTARTPERPVESTPLAAT